MRSPPRVSVISLFSPISITPIDRIQSRLLSLATLFVFIYSLILTISPAGRARTWQVSYRWDHWLGFLIWCTVFILAHRETSRRLPERDPYFLPATALLSGWGLMTIWRLLPTFGMRQSVWLLLCGVLFIAGLRLSADLGIMRRYKYLWLSSSLLLTGLTLIFGANPLGYGAPMWLGCCGVYFQPSEPLKLLLIVYLAAYMADRQPLLSLNTGEPAREEGFPCSTSSSGSKPKRAPFLPLIAPTLIMSGLALAILLAQRDLGTATIFLLLYAAIVYVTSRRKSVLVATGIALIIAGIAGYSLFDVVQIRVEAWINPWLDPIGRSYQIVQSLIAVANGGLLGRGVGLGNPGLVPVSHSDLIFTSIAEEHGFLGIIAFLGVIAVLAGRGLRTAILALDNYRRYLAAGLTVYLVGQSLVIMAGNLRLLPLTGVTLPFVSYGGSSLLTSMLSMLFLMIISNGARARPIKGVDPNPYLKIGVALFMGVTVVALAIGWWAVYRSPSLLTRTDNPRRAISDRFVRRGALLDRNHQAINLTIGTPGNYERVARYSMLSNIVGYTDPTYGQSGLEASLDEYLRGLRGNPGLSIWWDQLLYGQPPPGLDVRLSLDLKLQRASDELLAERVGAVVLMDSRTGEILAMASHPTFDSSQIDELWEQMVNDPQAPLLNRAVQGQYAIGDLSEAINSQPLSAVGLEKAALIRLPGQDDPNLLNKDVSGYSPLQLALLAATVSGEGFRPAPKLVTAIKAPSVGWVILPALGEPSQEIEASESERIAAKLAVEGQDVWQITEVVENAPGQYITWYLGGSLPGWSGGSYAVVVLLEAEAEQLAEEIGRELLSAAMEAAY